VPKVRALRAYREALRPWSASQEEDALSRHTDTEQVLFDDLESNALGQRLRFEQERIAFGWLKRELAASPAV
jgi:hypothetical protein